MLEAFKLMRQKAVGAVPVVESGGKAIGNISIRDIQYLLLAPAIYKNYRFVTKLLQILIRYSPLQSSCMPANIQKNDTRPSVCTPFDWMPLLCVYDIFVISLLYICHLFKSFYDTEAFTIYLSSL